MNLFINSCNKREEELYIYTHNNTYTYICMYDVYIKYLGICALEQQTGIIPF
jgi:hypothetical protein